MEKSRAETLTDLAHAYAQKLAGADSIKNSDARAEARENALCGLVLCVNALSDQCHASDSFCCVMQAAAEAVAPDCPDDESESEAEAEKTPAADAGTGVGVQTPPAGGYMVRPHVTAGAPPRFQPPGMA